MNYSSKNTISQQKADGPSDFLGITQSSGLDRLSGYPDNRSVAVSVYAMSRWYPIPLPPFCGCRSMAFPVMQKVSSCSTSGTLFPPVPYLADMVGAT